MALLEALNLKKYYGKGSYLVKAVLSLIHI